MAASPPGARSKISDSVFKNPGINKLMIIDDLKIFKKFYSTVW